VIKKNELIIRLLQLHREEESAISIYTKHLENTFPLPRIRPEAQEEIKSMLLTLIMESEVHTRMFEEILKKVKESKKDVY
jgi:rubrerythrin